MFRSIQYFGRFLWRYWESDVGDKIHFTTRLSAPATKIMIWTDYCTSKEMTDMDGKIASIDSEMHISAFGNLDDSVIRSDIL